MKTSNSSGKLYEKFGASQSLEKPRPDPSGSMDCLVQNGGAAVRRRTRDRKVAGSTPGWGAIKSTRSAQPSIPPG